MANDKPSNGGKIKEKIAEKAADKLVELVVGAIALLADGGFWFGLFSTGFYHTDWLKAYRAWIFLFVVAFLAGIGLTLSNPGFIILSVVAVFDAIAFGVLYSNPRFADGDWPFYAWLLHGVGLSLILAFAAGLCGRLWRIAKTERNH